MAQGNTWQDADVFKAIRDLGELHVHRKFGNYEGLRTKVREMQERGLVKEVYVNEDYHFYQATEKGSQSRSKRR